MVNKNFCYFVMTTTSEDLKRFPLTKLKVNLTDSIAFSCKSSTDITVLILFINNYCYYY